MNMELTLQILLNLVAGILLTIAFLRVPRGPLRLTFILFVVAMLCWLNPLLIMRRPNFDLAYSAPVARLIFCSGLATLIAFGFFLVMLFGRNDYLRGRVFWIFQANNLLLVAFVISGYVVIDFDRSASGQILPNYGPLHGYFILSWAAFGVFLFWLGASTYRNTTDEFTRLQIGQVFWSSLVTFVAIIFTNAVLPRLTGESRFSHLGPLSTLVVFGGILRLLVLGRKLVVDRALGHLLSLAVFRVDNNVAELRRLIDGLLVFFEKSPPQMRQVFAFEDGAAELKLQLERPGGPERVKRLSPGWLQGFLDSVRGLETENQRLAFALLRAEGLLAEQQPVKELTEPSLQKPWGLVQADDYGRRTELHLQEMTELFGREIFAMSPRAYRLMVRLNAARNHCEPTLFVGETGSGKALLARALHYAKGGGELVELSCEFESVTSLRQAIRKFIANSEQGGEKIGLLLLHIDALASTGVHLLEPLFRLDEGRSRVYFTTNPDSALDRSEVPESVRQGLARCLKYETIPLRDRPEDLRAATLHALSRKGPGFLLEPQLLQGIENRNWPGNFRELKGVLQSLLLTGGTGPAFAAESLLEIPAPEEILPPGLTPLEDAERRVIIRYLKKHAYNKSRTFRDLGITMNTLKAKIDRYGIPLPTRRQGPAIRKELP